MMELSEIRGRDERQLMLDLQELRKEQFNLRFRGFAEGVANTSRFRQIKRSVARILTVIRERHAAAASASGAAAAEPTAKTAKTATKKKSTQKAARRGK